MMIRRTTLLAALAVTLVATGCGGAGDSADADDTAKTSDMAANEAADGAKPAALTRTPAPEGARAFIVEPADGATVSSPVKVVFGAENIGVAAAGTNEPGTGHHHLLVDVPLPDFDQPIPSSDGYIHFGGGQTETTLELEPGKHELRLLFGDFRHVPHDPPIYSDVVTITVE